MTKKDVIPIKAFSGPNGWWVVFVPQQIGGWVAYMGYVTTPHSAVWTSAANKATAKGLFGGGPVRPINAFVAGGHWVAFVPTYPIQVAYMVWYDWRHLGSSQINTRKAALDVFRQQT